MQMIAILNKNFLCPFQILLDIAAQLPPASTDLQQIIFTPVCELTSTNDWINIEALGSPVAIRGQALSQTIASICKEHDISSLNLHIELGCFILTNDNLFALIYLANALENLTIHFYSHETQSAILYKTLTALSRQQNVKMAIHTQKDAPQALFQAEKVSSLNTIRTLTLHAHGFVFNENWFDETPVDQRAMGLLIRYAWTSLKAGAYELGCLALQKTLAKPTLTGFIYEQLFMQLQLVRFLSHQYEVVALEKFPDHFYFLNATEIANIYYIKAYCATLSRHLDIAKTSFAKAGIHKAMPMSDEASLFKLNIHALFLVLSGDIESAHQLELQIQDFIAAKQIDTLGLKYVNFINIARIYKKTKQFDLSSAYYEKAYHEIKGGGFTTADLIYYNMNLGSLYEATAQPHKALSCWIKAALYWLTFDNPYALSWRPRLILAQEKITQIANPLVCEKVNRFLIDKLTELSCALNLNLKNNTKTPLHFLCDTQKNLQKETCYIAENIILFSTQTTKQDAPFQCAGLQELVAHLLRTLLPIPDENLTVVIPHSYEDFYPKSAEDCLTLAALSGCKLFYYNGERLAFDNEQMQQAAGQTKLSLAPVIQSVNFTEDGVQLNCKRSFLNKRLKSPVEIDLIKQFSNKKMIALKMFLPVLPESIKSLVERKILTLVTD